MVVTSHLIWKFPSRKSCCQESLLKCHSESSRAGGLASVGPPAGPAVISSPTLDKGRLGSAWGKNRRSTRKIRPCSFSSREFAWAPGLGACWAIPSLTPRPWSHEACTSIWPSGYLRVKLLLTVLKKKGRWSSSLLLPSDAKHRKTTYNPGGKEKMKEDSRKETV